jgi:alpha,alpha-trehalose phosphorylase
MRVTVEPDTITFNLETGDAELVPVTVQGKELVITRGTPTSVPWASRPELRGRPSLDDIEGSIREDGSVIRATVPDAPTWEDVTT